MLNYNNYTNARLTYIYFLSLGRFLRNNYKGIIKYERTKTNSTMCHHSTICFNA